jgi:tetratricopeptide (TPR) repeat protein
MMIDGLCNMKRTSIYLIILTITAAVAYGDTVELTLYPVKAIEAAQEYRLLPKAEELIDANAVPLYEKAIQSFPEDYDREQIEQWLKIPLDKLPHQQVQSALQQFKAIMQLFEQAAKCRYCNWPYVEEDALLENLRKYRRFVFILELQARLQIAQRQYDKALSTIQIGFAMAKHLGDSPELLHGMVGVAISARMLRPLEQFIQRSDAPNLYWALENLPKPFIDLTERTVLESPEIREKMHLLMNRLDRHIATLQCIEALRLHAGAHGGKFPKELSDVTDISIPADPVTQKPFIYRRISSQAVLEAPDSKGADVKEAMRYELNLKEEAK